MLGAHLDSWHGGTGATDNATGSSVAIEAVRILKALNLQMDRTVRIALWSGEEEGLLGSQAYVKQHFADRETMQAQARNTTSKLDAYYNDDTGTGEFRGIGAQGNLQVKPIFEAWLKPFHDLGATTVAGVTSLPPLDGPAVPTIHPSITSDSLASASCRIRWSTTPGRIIPIWMSTIASSLAM